MNIVTPQVVQPQCQASAPVQLSKASRVQACLPVNLHLYTQGLHCIGWQTCLVAPKEMEAPTSRRMLEEHRTAKLGTQLEPVRE